MFEKVLTLSTAHMPETSPEFGTVRTAEHEYGYICFVSDQAVVPNWLKPIHDYAVEKECTLINFDRDADGVKGWREWEWE